MKSMAVKLNKLKVQYGVAIAFMVLAFAGGWSINNSANQAANKLRDSQVASCKRGNLLRAESNSRIASHTKERDTLVEFLRAAEKARRASPTANDKKAADKYGDLADSLSEVTFNPTPLVDCETAIAKP